MEADQTVQSGTGRADADAVTPGTSNADQWSAPGRATVASGPMPPVVELRDVVHRFGEIAALDHLSFVVPAQKITVLLGPNGAGKTTAIRAVTGALTPAEGLIRTFGHDPAGDDDLVRPRCGVVSAKPALYDRLSGLDNLRYSARLYGAAGPGLDGRIGQAAARFGIEAALDQQVGGYSTGMKTRLALARSILHEPDLLLFDEPTAHLDPRGRREFITLIRSLAGTKLIATHDLEFVLDVCPRVLVLDSGKLMADGATETILANAELMTKHGLNVPWRLR